MWDDIFRAVLLSVSGYASYFAKDARDKAQTVKVVVNGRSDRMQARIEQLVETLAQHDIPVPQPPDNDE